MSTDKKRSYSKPELKPQGQVEKITLGDKKFGVSDGWFFMGSPIATVS